MHHQSSNTAVLVFIREEREEAQIKAFRANLSLRASLRVVHTLNQHVKKITRQSGLPTFFVKGAQQVGDTFGERFTNAIESIYEAGYERVIAIGNDCLSLSVSHLQTIAAELERGTAMVLGPAKDGGAYAIGIQRNAFVKSEFIHLPWQTDQVFSALVNYIHQLNKNTYCLPPAIDADDALSFQNALNHLISTSHIYRLLKNILQYIEIQLVKSVIILSPHLVFTTHLRAPPEPLL